MAYRPQLPFTQPLRLLTPTYQTTSGVRKKVWPKTDDGALIFASFRTFGGTERDVNGVYAVEDTAEIETWFRPDIQSGCAVAFPDTGALYEIVGEPENIERRNQYLKCKVSRVKGGA